MIGNICEPIRHLATDIGSLTVDPNNTRVHSRDNLEQIEASLVRHGQDQPIVVNERTRNVIKGNGRLVAARNLGWTHIAVLFVDESDEASVARSISDNYSSDTSYFDSAKTLEMIQVISPDDASLRAMISDLEYSLKGIAEANEAGDEAGSVAVEPSEYPTVDELEIKPYEHYDYILVLADNVHDWNLLCTELGLDYVVDRRSKIVGLGRAVRARRLIELIKRGVRGLEVQDSDPLAGTDAEHPQDDYDVPHGNGLRKRKRKAGVR